MENKDKPTITVQVTVQAPVEKVWKCWTLPEHVTRWNFASPDWCSPNAENDLRAGGKFSYRMEARDGSVGFDFYGFYEEVTPGELITYTMGDGRRVRIEFTGQGNETRVVESFEAEDTNSLELQQFGWQSILDNFKKHAESDSGNHQRDR